MFDGVGPAAIEPGILGHFDVAMFGCVVGNFTEHQADVADLSNRIPFLRSSAHSFSTRIPLSDGPNPISEHPWCLDRHVRRLSDWRLYQSSALRMRVLLELLTAAQVAHPPSQSCLIKGRESI